MPRNKGFKLDWKGDDVLKQVVKATRQGIDEVMGKCVEDAQANVPVRTGNLKRSIKPQEPAHEERGVVVGVWGSADVNYALAVEVGTTGGSIQVKAHTRKGRSLRAHSRQTSPRRGRNMLRNAADKNYPRLEETIAKRLRRG